MPPADPERFPCFDGLRAIAAVAVLVTHVSFITTANRVAGGSYLARLDSGVAIFFVISGFLLYRPRIVAAFGGRPAPRTASYLYRRALRIYPAYWVAAIAIALGFGVKPWTGVADALAHLGLVHIYDEDTVVSGPISQAWSLGTEVTFYAALPLLGGIAMWVARRTARRLGPQLVFVAAIYLSSIAYRSWVALTQGDRAATMSTWLPGYLDQFALGMALAVLHSWTRTRVPSRWSGAIASPWLPVVSWLLAFGALTVAAFGVGLPTSGLDYSPGQQVGRQVTYGLWGLFLVVPAVFGPQDRGAVRWVLRNRVAHAVGLVSYGVYLWHQFFIDRFQRLTGTPEFGGRFGEALAFVLGGALVAGAASYLLVERPALALKDRWVGARRASTGALAPPSLVLGGIDPTLQGRFHPEGERRGRGA
ncbi:MAG TPA: acyltransferase [Acidimicrobiales bacterium]